MKPKHVGLTAFFATLAFFTPISFSYNSPSDVSTQKMETHIVSSDEVPSITPVVSAAEARVRIDHGLPMTRVPIRYSVYFFMLAIILANVFDSVRRNRQKKESEPHSLPLHTSSV